MTNPSLAAAAIALTITPLSHADTVRLYQAVVDNAGAIAPNGAVSTETQMTGFATFELTVPDTGGSPRLAYEVVFDGVDFGLTPTTGDDITALHIHDTTGVAHSAGTPHVLNIFGFPSEDDPQMVFDANASRVTGEWDDADLTPPGLPHAGNPMANSATLSSMLVALDAGELFLMLHTGSPNALPGTPGITIGGRIVPIPEPTTPWLALVACGVLCYRRTTC
ncbi:MAG: CHRD domain-containing protein [Planctomycetota bacterium]